MANEFSPESKRLYDELLYLFRTTLSAGDADDAIGCLDALLSAHWDDVLAEAANIAGGVIGPLWHLDTLHEICDRLNAARSATAQEG